MLQCTAFWAKAPEREHAGLIGNLMFSGQGHPMRMHAPRFDRLYAEKAPNACVDYFGKAWGVLQMRPCSFANSALHASWKLSLPKTAQKRHLMTISKCRSPQNALLSDNVWAPLHFDRECSNAPMLPCTKPFKPLRLPPSHQFIHLQPTKQDHPISRASLHFLTPHSSLPQMLQVVRSRSCLTDRFLRIAMREHSAKFTFSAGYRYPLHTSPAHPELLHCGAAAAAAAKRRAGRAQRTRKCAANAARGPGGLALENLLAACVRVRLVVRAACGS